MGILLQKKEKSPLFCNSMNRILKLIGGCGVFTLIIFLNFTLPILNLWTFFTKQSLRLEVWGGVVIFFVVFFFIFKLFRNFYLYVVSLFFCDYSLKLRYHLSLGALMLKNHPLWFGWYLVLSISCLYLAGYYPENQWISSVYLLSTIFRNFCILPLAGYAIIIQTHRLLLEDSTDTITLPLFSELETNIEFQSKFRSWCDWMDFVQPTYKSATFCARVGVGTSTGWFGLSQVHMSGNDFKKTFQHQKDQLDELFATLARSKPDPNLEIPNSQTFQVLDVLRQRFQLDVEKFMTHYSHLLERDCFYLGFMLIFNPQPVKEFKYQLFDLVHFANALETSYWLARDIEISPDSLKDLQHLAENNYDEDSLVFTQVSQGVSSCLERSQEFSPFIAKFFGF